ncbi:unnamed protein product [Phytophthora fragariaefolia]|uniref:Unnamed protein product n=1 Tax=Phytophthora fragariaefolia TaxID=1490495 RepID=A0A9W6X6M4_9STRA|nr:unnamed protein product [Phytophthora fragariaefolia]
MPDIQLPSSDDPRATVASFLIDAAGLEHQVTRLGAHNELTAVYNAVLAAHAFTLHARNHAVLRRAHEGFDLGTATVTGLNERLESTQQENICLEDEVERLRARATQVDSLEPLYRTLDQSSLEDAYGLQDELAAAQARISELEARVAECSADRSCQGRASTATSSDRAQLDRVQAELVTAQTDLVSARATLSAVNAQLATAEVTAAVRLPQDGITVAGREDDSSSVAAEVPSSSAGLSTPSPVVAPASSRRGPAGPDPSASSTPFGVWHSGVSSAAP